MEAIHTSTQDDSNGTASETSDKIIGKIGNGTRQARNHTWAPDTSLKLKFLHDLSNRVNPEVTEEVVHHDGLWVDGGLHLHLHVCKVIHPSLKSSDPFHRVLSLVNPITNIPHLGSVPIRVSSKGGGSSLEARLEVTVRGVVTTTLMVPRVATLIPSVPLDFWGWACGVVMVSMLPPYELARECEAVLWSCGVPLPSDQTTV
jgi:hypothetical protein